MENKSNERLNNLAVFISIIGNVALFIIKYWAGIVSGSIALLADAWHTLSDSLSSIIVLCGLKISTKKADKDHPFGHGRIEQIVSILVGIMLAVVAYEFIVEAIEKFQHPEADQAVFGTLAIVVTAISIISKELMAQMSFRIGKKTANSSIKADGWHHRSDALSSLIVLVGIFLQKYYWWIDAVLGICVSLVLLYAVYKIVREAINKILGENLTPEAEQKIKELISQTTNEDLVAHHFHIHNYGNHNELTFHIKLAPATTIKQAHDLADKIENRLRSEMNIEATIHIEPLE